MMGTFGPQTPDKGPKAPLNPITRDIRDIAPLCGRGHAVPATLVSLPFRGGLGWGFNCRHAVTPSMLLKNAQHHLLAPLHLHIPIESVALNTPPQIINN